MEPINKKNYDTLTAAITANTTKLGSMGNIRTFKGSCLFASLPATGMLANDYWYVSDKLSNYCYNGTSWIDIGDNINIGDNTITVQKTDFIYSKNLFNSLDGTLDHILSASVFPATTLEDLTVSINYLVSPVYKCIPGEIYSINYIWADSVTRVFWGDINENRYGLTPSYDTLAKNVDGVSPTAFTVPSNCYTFRIQTTYNSKPGWETKFMLYKGVTVPTVFVPYGLYIDDLRTSIEVVAARKGEVDLPTKIGELAQQTIPTSTIFKQGVDFASLNFRIPHLVITKHGTLIAGTDIRYTGVSDFGKIDNGTARSIDGGLTWINKQVIITNNNTTLYSRVMDSCIIYNASLDKLFVFAAKLDDNVNWYTKTDKTSWDLVYVTSIDDGITWSAPTSIATIINSFTNRMIFLTGVGSGIVMANGTMVLPIQCSNVGQSPFSMQSGFIYSSDSGVTWIMCPTLVQEYTSECSIIEYTGGLLINARSDNSGKRSLYRTTDMGTTWTPADCNYINSPNKLIQSTGCQASMVKVTLPNGSIKLLYSSPYNLKSDRSNTTLMSSIDNGNSWNVISTIYLPAADGYTSLCSNGNNLYIAMEIGGTIYFKDISKLLNYAEKDIALAQVTENTSYSLYVSNTGSDNNTGTVASAPLATIAQALRMFNYSNGNNLTINVMDNLTENINLTNISGIASLNIISNSTAVVSVGYLNVTNCSSRLFFNLIKFAGTLNTTNANYLYGVRNITLSACEFSSNASRLLYTAYCTAVLFSYLTLTKVGTGIQDALWFDVETVATVFAPIFSTTGFRYGIYSNQSVYNLSGTTADCSIVEGSTSILTNAINPLKSNNISTITCNLVIGMASYSNGCSAAAVVPTQCVYSARKSSLVGGITMGTVLTVGTVLATLKTILPRYTQYRLVIGTVPGGSTAILIKISTDGTIALAQAIPSTVVQIILDGINFDNNI